MFQCSKIGAKSPQGRRNGKRHFLTSKIYLAPQNFASLSPSLSKIVEHGTKPLYLSIFLKIIIYIVQLCKTRT
jgi:hypothetical protein